MTAKNINIAFAQWVRSEMAAGLPLSESVHDYMAATFGTTDLAAIIGQDTTGEVDSLLELIFFPDMDSQIRFESQWGNQIFTAKELADIQAMACQTSLTAVIAQSDVTTSIPIDVPNFVLSAFVQRLNITFQPAPLLVKTLVQKWPRTTAVRVRVHLRNARLAWHADQVQLINQFLTKMPPEAQDAEACIDFLLTILSEFAPKTDPFDFLIAKKFFYFQSLCKAEDFERKRHASNMEIMMLQGNRAAHGNVAQWRQQMQWIDRICYILFERTHFFQQPDEQSVDLQPGIDTQMIDEVIRTLS